MLHLVHINLYTSLTPRGYQRYLIKCKKQSSRTNVGILQDSEITRVWNFYDFYTTKKNEYESIFLYKQMNKK